MEISVPPSAGQENDDDQTIQGLVTRPSTIQTSYKFDSSSRILPSSNYVPVSTSFFDRFNSSSQSTSYSLNQRINKLIKIEKKLMKQKQELIKDINNWCNILPNDDCKKLLYHFIKIFETELEANDFSIKKKEQINVQLLNVNKRERRANDLKLKRNKMLIKLTDNENKIGDSPLTTLTKENLEELECSVEIVEDQFIRSINNGLKNSMIDYVSNLKESGLKFKENSDYFLENYFYSNINDNIQNNLQRIILQNKLNSTNGSQLTRSLSQDNFKYVALSPNQVGKYLDNKFDNNKIDIDTKDIDNNEEHHAPPPTAQPHDNDPTNYIINSYNTPGSLARPNPIIGSHEWT